MDKIKKDTGLEYLMSKHVLKHLLAKGIITEEEYNRINDKYRKILDK